MVVYFFQGQMQARVTAVLLWLAGIDATDGNAEAQPPDRQL